MDFLANLFWTALLVHVYAKMSAFFRVALLKEFSIEKIVEDKYLRFYNTVAILGLNSAFITGVLVVLVTLFNILSIGDK